MKDTQSSTINEINSLEISKTYLYEYKGYKYVVKKNENSIKIEPKLNYFIVIPLFLLLTLLLHSFFLKLFLSIKFDYMIDRYNIHTFFTVVFCYILAKKIIFLFKKDKKFNEFKSDLESYGYKIYKSPIRTTTIIFALLLVLLIIYINSNERN